MLKTQYKRIKITSQFDVDADNTETCKNVKCLISFLHHLSRETSKTQ